MPLWKLVVAAALGGVFALVSCFGLYMLAIIVIERPWWRKEGK